jgi:hypothetical protein
MKDNSIFNMFCYVIFRNGKAIVGKQFRTDLSINPCVNGVDGGFTGYDGRFFIFEKCQEGEFV